MSYQQPQGYGPPGYPPPGYPPQGPPPQPAGLNITVVVVAAIVVAGGVIGAAILTTGRSAPAQTGATPAAAPIALQPAAPPQDESYAEVECVPGGDAYVCSVRHVRGNIPVNVCWNIVADCQNGVRVVGSACQSVQVHGTASRSIPGTALRNIDRCDRAISTSIANMVLTPAL